MKARFKLGDEKALLAGLMALLVALFMAYITYDGSDNGWGRIHNRHYKPAWFVLTLGIPTTILTFVFALCPIYFYFLSIVKKTYILIDDKTIKWPKGLMLNKINTVILNDIESIDRKTKYKTEWIIIYTKEGSFRFSKKSIHPNNSFEKIYQILLNQAKKNKFPNKEKEN
nr:hypothetical protein [uncultured Desulfobacter sp.]